MDIPFTLGVYAHKAKRTPVVNDLRLFPIVTRERSQSVLENIACLMRTGRSLVYGTR